MEEQTETKDLKGSIAGSPTSALTKVKRTLSVDDGLFDASIAVAFFILFATFIVGYFSLGGAIGSFFEVWGTADAFLKALLDVISIGVKGAEDAWALGIWILAPFFAVITTWLLKMLFDKAYGLSEPEPIEDVGKNEYLSVGTSEEQAESIQPNLDPPSSHPEILNTGSEGSPANAALKI